MSLLTTYINVAIFDCYKICSKVTINGKRYNRYIIRFKYTIIKCH